MLVNTQLTYLLHIPEIILEQMKYPPLRLLLHSYSVRANLVLDSEEEAIEELKLLRKAGGASVCDVTSLGIRTKPEALPRISQATGLNVITGTGFYVDASLTADIKDMTLYEVLLVYPMHLPTC